VTSRPEPFRSSPLLCRLCTDIACCPKSHTRTGDRRGGLSSARTSSTACGPRDRSRAARSLQLSPYGASERRRSDNWAYSRLHGLSPVSFRISNIYGSRQVPPGDACLVAISAAASVGGRAVGSFAIRQTPRLHPSERRRRGVDRCRHAHAYRRLKISTGVEVSLRWPVGEHGSTSSWHRPGPETSRGPSIDSSRGGAALGCKPTILLPRGSGEPQRRAAGRFARR
jgi:nucleoside-diphosphate-sugar epimerase